VILFVVAIIVLLLVGYFVVHHAAKHLPDGKTAAHAQINFPSPQHGITPAAYFAGPV
jgi:hypothetical protein